MKLPETIYKQAADELQLPLGLVKRVNNFFWREGVKKALSNVDHTSVFIKNIGTIIISKIKLNKEILLVIEKIRRIENSSKFTGMKKVYIIEGYKNNLRKLLKMRNKIIKENYFPNGKTY